MRRPPNPVKLETTSFNFSATVNGHGWCELAPFSLSNDGKRLDFVFRGSRGPVSVAVSATPGGLNVASGGKGASRARKRQAEDTVRRVLRLEEDLEPFYRLVRRNKRLKWIADAGAGRLLRSPTVFEDVIKTICTTNCTWSLTRSMIANLVDSLGEETAAGAKAFPTPEAMAAKDERFFRERVKAGYRSAYLVEFARSVVNARIDPEEWLGREMPSPELKKKILGVKGVGNYAAENLLKLLGRYDGLALDSFLRSEFYRKHNDGEKCPDSKIESHYEEYGDWKGLAIWFEMSERWLKA